MPRLLAAVLAAALAGCSAHGSVRIGSGPLNGVPGSLVTSTSAGLSVHSTSTVGTLFLIGVLAAATYGESARAGGYRPSPFHLLDTSAPRAAPPLDAARRVNEQDCTRPIEDRSANLKCR